MATGERRLVADDRGNKTPGGTRGGSLPTEGTTLEGKHEYCTTKMQTVLHDGGARSQSGSQSHTDFDLAPFTS